jgi:HAD superfamily hydrolase (TIGR01509 family)
MRSLITMQLDIPPGNFAGYLFDLDGTLIDTMPVHFIAWQAALQDAGLRGPLDEDYFYSLGGMPTPRVAELMGRRYGLTLDPHRVSHEKELRYLEVLKAGVPLIEPVVQFARKIAATHPRAIVTGGAPMIAHPSLAASGLAELFDIVVTPHDVPVGRGKPAPDMFLLAAARLGVPPEKCLVFEDAAPGIAAARAAGMQVVLVPSRG